MKIYLIHAIDPNYGVLVNVTDPWKQDACWRGISQIKDWKPIPFVNFREIIDRPAGDFSGTTLELISEKAAECLKEFLKDTVELLPVDCPEGQYYIMNVLNVISALDLDRSDLKQFSDGGIFEISKYQFFSEKLKGEHIFKLKEYLVETYVDEEFRNAVTENGLTGLVFFKVWSDEEEENTEAKPIEIREIQVKLTEPDHKCYEYVNKDVDFLPDVKEAIEMAEKDIKRENDGENDSKGIRMAKTAYRMVEDYLSKGKLPESCENKDDLIFTAGVLFGEALREEYNWQWAEIGNEKENPVISLLSPKEYYSNMPFEYIKKIIEGRNPGFAGENDNTVLLLFNMLKTIEETIPEGYYQPVS